MVSVTLFLIAVFPCVAHAARVEQGQPKAVSYLKHSINRYRLETWHRQDDRLAKRTRVDSCERSRSIPYLEWCRGLWKQRAKHEAAIAKRYSDPYRAIRHVFGSEAQDAISVAYCETGGNLYWTTAGYGKHDYWGIFQLGSGERSRYGFSWTILGQVISAHRMYLVRGWSAWQCMPGGGLRW